MESGADQLPADSRETNKIEILDLEARLQNSSFVGSKSTLQEQLLFAHSFGMPPRSGSTEYATGQILLKAQNLPRSERSQLFRLQHPVTAPGVTMGSGDWRARPSRNRIRYQIVDTLKMHLRSTGRHKLGKIADRVEEEVFAAATCQSEYIDNIRLNLRAMEDMVQNPTADPPIRSSSDGDGDWHAEVFQQLEALKDQHLFYLRITQGVVGQQYSVTEQTMKVTEDLSLLNLMPTQGADGAVGDTALEPGDWRAQLQAGLREINRNQIMGIFMKHLSFLGHERLQDFKTTAEMVEEMMYTAARSESEYWQRIGMLDLDAGLQYPLSSSFFGSPMMPEVNNTLEGQGLMSQSMHRNNISLTGMQGYSSLSSALPPPTGH